MKLNTLKELRVEAGLTQKELADKINIGQSTIVGYERGEREATLTNLSRYADYFNVSIDFLAGRTDDIGAPTAAPMGEGVRYSKEEKKLIEDYRDLNTASKKLVKQTVETLRAASAQSEQKKNKIS